MLSLEAVSENHLNWLKNQRNRREIMDYCRQPFFLSDAAQEDWFKRVTRDRSMIPMIVSEGNRWIGYTALSNIDWIARTAEFSCFISPDENGKGYHKEALRILMDYAFGTLNLNKLYSQTFDFNLTEMDTLKELGFVGEGLIKDHFYKNGRLVSAVLFAKFANTHDFQPPIRGGKPT